LNLIALRAMLTVAAVYGYFLLFAQFAFIELIRAGGNGGLAEKVLLGTMAFVGIASGFLTAWLEARPLVIRSALVIAAIAAALATLSGTFPMAMAVAILTGSALGAATVALAALLPGWCGLIWVGAGTGLGYAICNLPPVFQAGPPHQAAIAAILAITGAIAVPPQLGWKRESPQPIQPFPAAILLFTALVWMDSAAFFIIQHAQELKSGTWGAAHLWRNAALHLALAIAAGMALTKLRPQWTPMVGWLFLAIASLAVNSESSRTLAGWLYPAGVSIYSVALVVWPGWFCAADDPKSAGWRAAWLFGIAGWFGSANGIGMAKAFNRVPVGFIAAAGFVVLGAFMISHRNYWKTALAIAAVIACGLTSHLPAKPSPTSAADHGRVVYLAEGCIHCHSRYLRTGSPDEALWGPALEPDAVLAETPVLIGNRRQGPDLTNIGARRSAAWLRIHFINPRSLAPDSVMPSYAHLFEDDRGDALIAYLKQSGIENTLPLIKTQSAWTPRGSSRGINAKALFQRHCTTCHGPAGNGSGMTAAALSVPPTNLHSGPFIRTGQASDTRAAIARVIKYGVIGSDMPGHETLTDDQVLSLSELLISWRREK
jgi:cytochrome c oxidase cbb3-type subunit 2